jgi:hypothetical protein
MTKFDHERRNGGTLDGATRRRVDGPPLLFSNEVAIDDFIAPHKDRLIINNVGVMTF